MLEVFIFNYVCLGIRTVRTVGNGTSIVGGIWCIGALVAAPFTGKSKLINTTIKKILRKVDFLLFQAVLRYHLFLDWARHVRLVALF